MGKKSGGSAPLPDPSIGYAQAMQAQLATNQNKFYQEEIYPWMKAQAELQNANAASDREEFRQDAAWWRDYTKEQDQRQNAIADEYRGKMQSIAYPALDKLQSETASYNSGAEMERQAGYAIGDTAAAFGNQRQQQAMRMQAFGIDPTSGAYQGQDQAMNIQQAGVEASAANMARQAAKELGWQKNLQLASIGTGMGAMANQNYGLGMQGASIGGGFTSGMMGQQGAYGQIGLGNINTVGNSSNQNFNSMQNAWGQYGNLGVQKSNLAMQAWQTNQQNKAANAAGIGKLVGGLAGSFFGPMGSVLGSAAGNAILGKG